MGADVIYTMTLPSAAITCRVLSALLALSVLASGHADKCSESEFEAPHTEWSPACVARFISRIGLKDHAQTFAFEGIEGQALRELNATTLEGMNITRSSDQQNILENIARLERHNPASTGESVLYLPIVLCGCGAVVYVMFLKGSHFERSLLRSVKRITKKANAIREGGMTDNDDWLQGTAASMGQGDRSRRKKAGSTK